MPEVTLFQPTGQMTFLQAAIAASMVGVFLEAERAWVSCSLQERHTAHACTALTFSSFGMFPPPSESKDLMISEYNFGQSMTQRDCVTFVLWEFNFRFFYGVMLVLFPRKPSGFIKCDCPWHWWCSVINIISIFNKRGFSYTWYVSLFSTCIQHL